MIKFFCFSFIIVFLAQSGNVFSDSNLFDVDNIKINKNNSQTKEEILEYAFKEGFEKLIKKIVLKKNFTEALNISSNDIKSLISNYQITESKEKNIKEQYINLSFNRERINEFFYAKKISYADISKTKILLFPILKDENGFNLFSKNYFFDNWLNEENNKNNLIDYVLPLESAELIQMTNKQNIESMPMDNFVLDYDIKNYFIVIIKPNLKKIEIFLKGTVFNNQVIKNIDYETNSEEKNISYLNTIKIIKQEINEIWKSQNLIDVRTPTFLNIILDIKKDNDLLNLQKALNNIELIENYRVLELNKNYAKIKIKYLGSIDKIKNKFEKQNILISIINNEWKLRLI